MTNVPPRLFPPHALSIPTPASPRAPAHGPDGLVAPIFAAPCMQLLLRHVAAFSDCEQPVLIRGDTGVGKEYIARMLHHGHARRADGPFIVVNCGAVPEGLFESLFFGHVRGAFTGAAQQHRGFFEQANGGTLFLDEIGDLPPAQQVKLLRTLEDHTVTRVGGTEPVRVDVRIVAASHHNLRDLVRQGTFRSDLFYRLAVIEIEVPSLKERGPEECVALFRSMVGELADTAPDWLFDRVAAADFPGNVRQLRNLAERVRVLVEQTGAWPDDMLHQVLERTIGAQQAPAAPASPEQQATRLARERTEIMAALQSNGWNRVEAAKELGISRKTLWHRMRLHGI